MPNPTAHADDMKSPAIIKPNEMPAFWWVNPWKHARLKAEVERLRKAGDALAGFDPCIGHHDCFYSLVDAWNAAKEGKPSV